MCGLGLLLEALELHAPTNLQWHPKAEMAEQLDPNTERAG